MYIYWRSSKTLISKEAENRMTDNTMTPKKRTNNDLQNITPKTKDRATRTPLKHRVNSGTLEG
jgi:hypothetical protein